MTNNATWQNDFERISLQDPLSQQISYNDPTFQLRISQPEKEHITQPFHSPVTLRYRDSISSTGSSLSRNSTVSSIDTRCSTAATSPLSSRTPSLRYSELMSEPTQSPQSAHTPEPSYFHTSLPQYHSIIEPTGCFVPCKPLSFIQKTHVTKHHYVVPTFAMAGQSQADVIKLLFNQVDHAPFAPKEEYERTIPWHIDQNNSLVTLSHYTCLGKENPVSRNYLLSLGQRLGVTTILVIVSVESIDTVYPLLDALTKAMELNTHADKLTKQPSWWNRVVLVINQQHDVSDQIAYTQRKNILVGDMPRIQERYRISQPLSTLFVSTQVYDQIKQTQEGVHYQRCCQRILWQMMQKHTLSGRWCSELSTLQNRMNSTSNTLNILTEDDESSSSSDESLFVTVIDYVDGKIKKPTKKKKKQASSSLLQRRSTRRQVQKLHCHDGDDGSVPPMPVRPMT